MVKRPVSRKRGLDTTTESPRIKCIANVVFLLPSHILRHLGVSFAMPVVHINTNKCKIPLSYNKHKRLVRKYSCTNKRISDTCRHITEPTEIIKQNYKPQSRQKDNMNSHR